MGQLFVEQPGNRSRYLYTLTKSLGFCHTRVDVAMRYFTDINETCFFRENRSLLSTKNRDIALHALELSDPKSFMHTKQKLKPMKKFFKYHLNSKFSFNFSSYDSCLVPR